MLPDIISYGGILMENRIIKRIIRIEGMTCASCELRISNGVKKLEGVIKANVSFGNSTAEVVYDQSIVTFEKITSTIEKLGYKVNSQVLEKKNTGITQVKNNANFLIGAGIILFALYMIINKTIGFNFIPEINQSMGYGILFAVGLLTSLHCVAMCGGINLSQCVSYKGQGSEKSKLEKLKPSFLYNAGRVVSYTILGGIVGAIGSVVSFSGTAKGIVAIVSGAFMIIMGLNMLNIFPWLRRFNPRMPKLFGNKIYNNQGKYGPFYVGLLNGLMPCGPLQAMQLYALGTGSFFAGAMSMLIFSLGTVPLMFGLGALSSMLSSKFTHRMLKVSAVLVLVLGVVMMNRGFNLSGFNLAAASPVSSAPKNIAKIENGTQYVSIGLESGSYSPIVVQKGIPVKWTITAQAGDLNGCNNPVTIPKYGIQKKLTLGDNTIEFTPEEEGNITYTCWMGMISSTIKVVDDINNVNNEKIEQDGESYNPPAGSGGGCCG